MRHAFGSTVRGRRKLINATIADRSKASDESAGSRVALKSRDAALILDVDGDLRTASKVNLLGPFFHFWPERHRSQEAWPAPSKGANGRARRLPSEVARLDIATIRCEISQARTVERRARRSQAKPSVPATRSRRERRSPCAPSLRAPE